MIEPRNLDELGIGFMRGFGVVALIGFALIGLERFVRWVR